MIKKIAKIALVIIVAAAALYGIGRLGVVLYGSYQYVDRQPYLQKQTQESVVVKWQTPEKEKGCVLYGENDLSQKRCEEAAEKYHRVELKGLKKATTYLYGVEAKSLKIDNTDRYFTTLSGDTNMTQRIWVLGDSGNYNEGQQEVRRAMKKHLGGKKIDTWLTLGDNAYRSGTQEQYNRGLFNAYPDTLKHNALWAVTGNHDARRWAFYDIFEFPVNGEAGGVASGSEKYYSFENGNVHFVMLDSETEERGAGGDMAKWLERDLAANKKLWTIVLFHHPPYTKGSHDSDSYYDSRGRMVQMRENILPILEKHDADLVMSGHSHVYERSLLSHRHYGYSDTFDAKKNVLQNDLHDYKKCDEKRPYSGTIYNVAGTSSADQSGINPFNVKHPMMPLSYFTAGSLLITIEKKKMEVEFVMRDGNVLDRYSIEKSAAFCQ
ncbi:MAG: metallophosphoesterase family protein [Thiovulaceae bacterium]|nr:metallophosphoesterase family protein [Sulfurimonadaceae bacterium]